MLMLGPLNSSSSAEPLKLVVEDLQISGLQPLAWISTTTFWWFHITTQIGGSARQ